MDSFHELHIDIPISEFLSSEPNSSTITPSPKPDTIPEVLIVLRNNIIITGSLDRISTTWTTTIFKAHSFY